MSAHPKPRVLFVNQYYRPDNAATAQLLADLAEWLVRRGWAVTVLAGRGAYRRSERRMRPREHLYGVRVFRVPTTGFGRGRTLGRLLDYVSFCLAAGARALTLPRHDLIVTLTSPPMIHVLGALLKRLRGWRFVLWGMDVYPDVAAALGVLSSQSRAFRTLAQVNRGALRSADGILALGGCMAERLVAAGAQPEKVHVAPNWSDGENVVPVPPERNPFRRRHGLDGRFVVAYSGNVGLGHTFDALVEGARRLRSDPNVVFLVIGDGPALPRVMAMCKRYGLSNLVRLPWQRRERLASALSAGDLHVVTLRRGLEGLLVPSKLYGIMAAGRPVIFVGPERCDTARTIRQAGCGFRVAEDDADGFLDCLQRLRADRALRERLGRNGRMFFLRHFDRPVGCARIERILRGIVAAGPTGAPHRAGEKPCL